MAKRVAGACEHGFMSQGIGWRPGSRRPWCPCWPRVRLQPVEGEKLSAGSLLRSRKVKVLESLIGLIRSFPYDDPTYERLHEDLNRIRGKFRQVCARWSTGVCPLVSWLCGRWLAGCSRRDRQPVGDPGRWGQHVSGLTPGWTRWPEQGLMDRGRNRVGVKASPFCLASSSAHCSTCSRTLKCPRKVLDFPFEDDRRTKAGHEEADVHMLSA